MYHKSKARETLRVISKWACNQAIKKFGELGSCS